LLFSDHVKELNNVRPKQPFFFLKPTSSILLPGQGAVERPSGVNLHYEVELGLVMGKEVKNLDPNDEKGAMDSIECKAHHTPNPHHARSSFAKYRCSHDGSAAYFLGIDMSARNIQEEAKKKGLPWSISKGFDTFLPISHLIPKSAIPDPHNALIWLKVNNTVRQSDNTELMLFRIPRLLSDVSRVMTLEKGDLVITGTPKGVGPVVTGDVMTAGIQVDGKDVQESLLEVPVVDKGGPYEFSET
jgi:acylpyruvate hydrolase